MGHSHDHGPPESGLRLLITTLLNFFITAAQVVGGIWSGSLSLLSDALHNASDGIAIIISWVALRLAGRPRTERYTFGLRRAEVLAAVINAAALVGICLFLLAESVRRFLNPEPVAGGLMMIFAALGLVANVAGTLLLKHGARGSMNLRSAYLHLLSDAVSSAGVLIGGAAIYYFRVWWVDPLLTVLISIYVCKESLEILWAATEVLMMSAPRALSLSDIGADLEQIDGVRGVHHAHLWSLDDVNVHFEAHVDVDDRAVSSTASMSAAINRRLAGLGINHVTLQFECDTCADKGLICNSNGTCAMPSHEDHGHESHDHDSHDREGQGHEEHEH